jgi:quercetin dioxygenase-like cupin family protein
VNGAPAQVVDALEVASPASGSGVLWSAAGDRELEVNVVHLPAGGGVGEHRAGLDVAIAVLAGDGELTVDGDRHPLRAAVVAFVPKGAARAVHAGPAGLVYVTAHRRRSEGIGIGPAKVRPDTAEERRPERLPSPG